MSAGTDFAGPKWTIPPTSSHERVETIGPIPIRVESLNTSPTAGRNNRTLSGVLLQIAPPCLIADITSPFAQDDWLGQPVAVVVDLGRRDQVVRLSARLVQASPISALSARTRIVLGHWTGEDLSCTPRFRASGAYVLLGHFDHPFRFHEHCAFRVGAVDAHRIRFCLERADPPVLPGMIIRLVLAIPKHPRVVGVTVRIADVSVDAPPGRRSVVVNAFFLDSSTHFLEALGTYLVGTTDATPKSLRDAGFPRVHTKQHLQFRALTAGEALQPLLAFRLQVHHADGVYADVNEPDDMRDDLDAKALHIVGYVGNRIVATARLVHVGRERQGSEHQRAGAPIPDAIWGRGFVEAGRVLVDPAYRGSDVFVRVMQELALAAVLSGEPYVLGSCVDDLLGAYRQVGFRRIGTFATQHDSVRWNLLSLRTREAILGKSGPLAGWALILSPVLSYLFRHGWIELSLFDRMRLALAGHIRDALGRLPKTQALLHRRARS